MTTDTATAPAIDPRQLRDVLGTFVTGVTVVTTRDGEGRPYGVTANSFSSVSLDPPLVLWSQAVTSRSHPAFAGSDSFVVNILADDQIAVSNQFAKSGDDKFRELDYRDGIGGCPVLGGTAARLECTKVAAYPSGDHVVFLGRVEQMHRSAKRPLAFAGGRYMVAYSHDLGPVSLHLGGSDTPPQQLEAIRLATAALPAICEAVGDHTACLGVWGNHGPTIVHWERSRRPVSEYLRTGLVVSPTRSAVGRAFSAWLAPEMTRPFVEEDLRLFRFEGDSADEQKKRFEQELEEVRARGLARTADVRSPLHQRATNAFCAPIRDARGEVVLAMAITSAADRLATDWDTPAAQMLKRETAALSARLGFVQ